MSWLDACYDWRLRAEQTGGRFLWGDPKRRLISLLWGRRTRLVHVP